MKNGRVNAGKTGRPRYFMAGPHAPIIPVCVWEGIGGRLGSLMPTFPFPPSPRIISVRKGKLR